MLCGCGKGSSELQVSTTVADSDRTPSLTNTRHARLPVFITAGKWRRFRNEPVTHNLWVHEWQVGFEAIYLEPLGPGKYVLSCDKESHKKRDYYNPMLSDEYKVEGGHPPSMLETLFLPAFFFLTLTSTTHTRAHTQRHTCVHTHMCMLTCTHAHVHTHTQTCTCAHVCMHTCTYSCTHTCTHTISGLLMVCFLPLECRLRESGTLLFRVPSTQMVCW